MRVHTVQLLKVKTLGLRLILSTFVQRPYFLLWHLRAKTYGTHVHVAILTNQNDGFLQTMGASETVRNVPGKFVMTILNDLLMR